MTEPCIGVVDREERIRPIASDGGVMGSANEPVAEELSPDPRVQRLAVGVDDDGAGFRDEGKEGLQNGTDCSRRLRRTASMTGLMSVSLFLLEWSESSLATQGGHFGGDEKEGGAVDQDRDRERLEPIGLE
jgi:hypothetical protein